MSAALDILKKEVVTAAANWESIKADEKQTIEAGQRSQRKVDDASRRLGELTSAVSLLSDNERGVRER
jgi:hypothetical protein